MKNIVQFIKVVMLAIVLSFGLSYVFAWTVPTQNPPAGNVSAPINTGDNTQYKMGNLVLNNSSIPFVYGLIVANGKVGIGTSTPAQKLSVAGTIESTSGGFKFPDGTTQATAAVSGGGGGGGTMTSVSAGAGITLSPNPITTSGTITNAGVTSFNNNTGAVTGVSSVSAGTGINVSPAAGTGAVTVTNTGVTSFNNGTGAVTGVASITGGSCAVGQVVTSISSTGAVTCGSAGGGAVGPKLFHVPGTGSMTVNCGSCPYGYVAPSHSYANTGVYIGSGTVYLCKVKNADGAIITPGSAILGTMANTDTVVGNEVCAYYAGAGGWIYPNNWFWSY